MTEKPSHELPDDALDAVVGGEVCMSTVLLPDGSQMSAEDYARLIANSGGGHAPAPAPPSRRDR